MVPNRNQYRACPVFGGGFVRDTAGAPYRMHPFTQELRLGIPVVDKWAASTGSLLAAVASGAAFIPAWRASRFDPMAALRTE